MLRERLPATNSKQGANKIPPFLFLDVYKHQRNYVNQKLSRNGFTFLLEYLASAQYLELDMFYWDLIHHSIQAGYPVVFPNLNTMLVEQTWARYNSIYQIQIPAHALRALQRLSISEIMTPPNDFVIPHHWSTLTHLYLHISISSTLWLSLIRAVPHLQWAYLDIVMTIQPSGIDTHIPYALQCTLLELTTLSVAVRGRLEQNSAFPLRLLFTNLHLPSLHTLSLSFPGAKAWEDRRALSELYAVLNSTPAVTKLALQDKTLSFGAQIPPIVLPELQEPINPIWTHATELMHLQLALPAGSPECKREELLALFVHHIFSAESAWLDLRNPACPICTITISNSESVHRITEQAMSRIRESTEKVPEVILEITSESAGQVAADVLKEWGSKL